MKKFILIFLILSSLIFIIPLVFTNKNILAKNTNSLDNKEKDEESDNKVVDNVTSEDTNYDYKDYTTIKLLHKKEDNVEEINLDKYLYGVVAAEMPASYEIEGLKAQAIVARTYTLYSIKNSKKHEKADICDDSSCCQAWISKDDRLAKWEDDKKEEYLNKILEAVNSTKGKVIVYNGELIDAFFHSNSGGVTETPVNVWGGTNYPYLQSVQTSGEDNYTQYSSEVTLSKEDFIKKIKEKHSDLEIDFSNSDAIKIEEYTSSNRVKTIKIGNLNLSGVEVRSLLGLKSTNFTFEIDDSNITFKVCGYGHGVGMSQTGANTLAKEGKDYEYIIKHFYTGVEIVEY